MKDWEGLHVCPECDSHLVQPVHGREGAQRQWLLLLRCPECEWHLEAVFPTSLTDAYAAELERGTAIVAQWANRLQQSYLQQLDELVFAALEADLLGPDDFLLSAR